MDFVTTGEIVITAFVSFVSAGFGTVLWARLNRIESGSIRRRRRTTSAP
jgi:hypothetical protein